MSSRKICLRCVSDTTIPSIKFNHDGICQFCEAHNRLHHRYDFGPNLQLELDTLVEKIRAQRGPSGYDCIIGMSGGTDSCYLLALACELGLKPLAVHFDNGWNTAVAASNIKKLVSKLNVDLETYVVDWEEFRDLQLSFLRASVPCLETPSEIATHSILYQYAAREKLHYILGGQSFRTEGTVPREWSYLDGTYLKSVHRQFGTQPLKHYPCLTVPKVYYYTFIRGIKNIPLLNYINYRKDWAKEMLKQRFDWEDYGGHHFENVYAKFIYGWLLPKKFNIDKRIISLSGPVRSGQLTRQVALEVLKTPPHLEPTIIDYCLTKLRLSKAEFDKLINLPNRKFSDFYSSYSYLRYCKQPMKLAIKRNYFTPVLYEKYFS